MTQKLSRRSFLKTTSRVAGIPVIAGFPELFPTAALAKGDPPKPTKKSTKVVSQSKPTDKKTGPKDTNKNGNNNNNGNDNNKNSKKG